MDRGAWLATVWGLQKSDMTEQLTLKHRFYSHSHFTDKDNEAQES